MVNSLQCRQTEFRDAGVNDINVRTDAEHNSMQCVIENDTMDISSDESGNDEQPESVIISSAEALLCLEKVKMYASQCKNNDMLSSAYSLCADVAREATKMKIVNAQQTTIYNYFK